MGEFTGFEFGGVKSADLGIIRVSGGDRYDEQLHPEIKDRTVEVPGLNGEYYFGSDYGTRTFDIEIAFDSLTEEQFRQLRQTFGTKEIKKLIFDERPYKYYMAKLESPIELSYVCFDEPKKVEGASRPGVRVVSRTDNSFVRETVTPYVNTGTKQRIYKGEGKISFVCYFPFAKSAFKQLPPGDVQEWASSSGILSANNYHNIIDTYNNGIFTVYNPGDIETGFRLYLSADAVTTKTTINYKVSRTDAKNFGSLVIKPIPSLKSGDDGILIDTNNCLIVGANNMSIDDNYNITYTTTGNLYNQYVESGYFFHLQPNTLNERGIITINDTNESNDVYIFYDYLYF